MMGQKCTDFDNLAQSGIAELGNVITGRATIKLEEAGYKSMISPPTMIAGRGVKISTLDFSRIVVPLKTNQGDIMIHLALRESPPGSQDKNFVPISVNA
jgi:chemotaxis protein CheX